MNLDQNYLNLIANINDECMFGGLHGDPPAVSSDLQAEDLVIGEQQRQSAGIGM